jgi:hypothetical protein
MSVLGVQRCQRVAERIGNGALERLHRYDAAHRKEHGEGARGVSPGRWVPSMAWAIRFIVSPTIP